MNIKNSLKKLARNTLISAVVTPALLLSCSGNLNNPNFKDNNYLKTINDTIEEYNPIKTVSKIGSIINDQLINAIVHVESNGNSYALSDKGARGLMQITEPAWKEVNEKKNLDLDYMTHVHNPKVNRLYGKFYLEILVKDYIQPSVSTWNKLPKEEQVKLLTASYNAGPGKAKRNGWKIQKLPYETREYVKKINNLVF